MRPVAELSVCRKQAPVVISSMSYRTVEAVLMLSVGDKACERFIFKYWRKLKAWGCTGTRHLASRPFLRCCPCFPISLPCSDATSIVHPEDAGYPSVTFLFLWSYSFPEQGLTRREGECELPPILLVATNPKLTSTAHLRGNYQAAWSQPPTTGIITNSPLQTYFSHKTNPMF